MGRTKEFQSTHFFKYFARSQNCGALRHEQQSIKERMSDNEERNAHWERVPEFRKRTR